MFGVLMSAWIVLAVAALACRANTAGHDAAPSTARILLFAGTGTSRNDVVAIERVLANGHFEYSTATSQQLDDLSESQLRGYELLVVPGGNFVEIGNGLGASTTLRVRNAIANGLNYFGVCAGAFFAGHSPYNGLNVTSGVAFPFYTAEDRRIRKAAVAISTADGRTLDQYWEDGPQLAGWGEVVGKYPDGTPAVVQRAFGRGWVVLTGVHPEAPEGWRAGLTFKTPASASHAYAAMLIDGALHGRPLAHY
jgi:hypothetical protein